MNSQRYLLGNTIIKSRERICRELSLPSHHSQFHACTHTHPSGRCYNIHIMIGRYASKFMVCFLHLLNSACTMYLKFFEKIAVMYRRGFACKGDDESRCNYQGIPLYWHRCTGYLGRICYNCSPVIPSHQRLSWQSWQQWKIGSLRFTFTRNV